MEIKLTHAAQMLPETTLDFHTIECAAGKKEKYIRKPLRLIRVALAVMIMLVLATTGFAFGKVKYGLWSGMHSYAFSDVKILSRQYDYIFPEILGESSFLEVSTAYGAPRGASHLEALLAPSYKLCSIDYDEEIPGMEAEENSWNRNRIRVSFGSTENENWMYHFSVAEDGSCNYENVDPDSQKSVEYEGYTLHLYTIGGTPHVRWEDGNKRIVISLSCGDTHPGRALEIAKELIDMNQ